MVQVLNFDNTEHFSDYVRGFTTNISKKDMLVANVVGSLILFFVLVLSLLRPLLRDIFFAKKEEEPSYVPVKALMNSDKFVAAVRGHECPSTPTRLSKSKSNEDNVDLAALKRIHKKALNLHSLLGMTFKHLEHCEGDLQEVMDQLTLAEASVASSCVSLLDEIETEIGGITLPRSPVQLPKPQSR